ncbi:hypothetical protein C7M84_011340 [Penaeus vannamei]|uniref:Uncharacterized protein n=1 Tax=Penaeus vannamei TaxID=6689 RepID=A0A423T1T4_PENVA|nr:hypothetical protein C7M84_011340 [Penaeus vannamei]
MRGVGGSGGGDWSPRDFSFGRESARGRETEGGTGEEECQQAVALGSVMLRGTRIQEEGTAQEENDPKIEAHGHHGAGGVAGLLGAAAGHARTRFDPRRVLRGS